MKYTTRVWSLEDILQRRQQGAKCQRGWIAARQKIYAVWYTIVYTYTHSVHHGGTSITSVGGTPNQYSSNIQIVQNNVSNFCSVWYTGNIQIVPGVIRSKMSELDGIQKDSPACKTWRFKSRLQICQMSATTANTWGFEIQGISSPNTQH